MTKRMKLLNNMYEIVYSVSTASRTEYCVRLNPQHIIYRAHFPNHPVTPGVCIVQMAKEIVEERLGKRLRMAKVLNAKFLSVMSPDNNGVVTFCLDEVSKGDNEVKARLTVRSGEVTFSKLSIICEEL